MIEIPLWAYLLLIIVVVLLGVTASRPKTMPVKRLIIFPSLVALWNLIWLGERVHEEFSLFPVWMMGLIVGVVIGWLTVRKMVIHVDHYRRTISLPGTWTPLLLILIVFFVHYFFNYSYETYPKDAPHLFSSDAFLSGALTGIFIGRSAELYQKYRRARS